MTALCKKRREHPNLTLMRDLKARRAFSSLAAGPGGRGPECMIRVSWSAAFDKNDDGDGPLLRRGEVTADLGLDSPPEPCFTDREMQDITFAAKMAALKCLRQRKKAKGS